MAVDPTSGRLRREDIVAAALLMVDEEGLDGLTMRNVASRLGVTAGALYLHVRSREELCDAVRDAVIADLTFDPAAYGRDWRRAVREFMRSTRRQLVAHPGALDILRATPRVLPGLNRHNSHATTILRGAGLTGPDLVLYSRLLLMATIGFLHVEAPVKHSARPLGGVVSGTEGPVYRFDPAVLDPDVMVANTDLIPHLLVMDIDALFDALVESLVGRIERVRRASASRGAGA